MYPSYDSSHPFWVNTYRIIEKAHYEAEYYRLDVTAAYIDVSGLKMANDTLGHPEGGQYLKIIANSLNESLNKIDILARIGGDELLIVSNSTEKDTLESMLSKIIEYLKTAGREGYRPSEFTDLFYPQQ
ncbi:MAG: diguanylate cyclase domain-containing protein [Enterocloster aldenensis]